MPHDFQSGFYTTSAVASPTPANKIVNPKSQVSLHGGENTDNVKTEANDIKPQK